MNKKGFTLVEVLTVIVLLSLILGIAVPNITKASKKAKERTLLTKVKNIEKAAILYGQDHRGDFDINNSTYNQNNTNKEKFKYCLNGDTVINNCYYFNKGNSIIVENLIENSEGKKYINADDESGNIVNPTDKEKKLNSCKIQIYKKYGKIYAVYLKESDDPNDKCWK